MIASKMIGLAKRFVARVIRKDMNVFIDPVTLRHIKRYSFAAQYLRGPRILDAACGSGYGADILRMERADVAIDYHGVDYAGYNVEFARKNYKGQYHCCSVFEMPFGGSGFDTIISFETIEHVDQPLKMVSILADLLNPGGNLIASIPLNHPDMIYHKVVFNFEEVQQLLDKVFPLGSFSRTEFIQTHLRIESLSGPLSNSADGTWIGVITRKA